MTKTWIILIFCFMGVPAIGQKKKSQKKEISNYEIRENEAPVPSDPKTDSKKGKSPKKSKKEPLVIEYITVGDEAPEADTTKKFTGIIKYRMTYDDPSEVDSMYIYFGEKKIRVTLFVPGVRADQIFENTSIANFADSTFTVLDNRTRTYRTEKLDARNAGTEFFLINRKKFMNVLGLNCPEFSGEMILNTGERFEAACLVSPAHTYPAVMEYNYLNIQPVVFGYKIVLGWRTKSSEGENTYILAYDIRKGNVEQYFDFSGYLKK
ncbi:MAG: hypothetical protein N2747_02495 [Chitinophagaceae bacterium]|nr:hypothetical protein [Chitinophagaceae bacterium]